MYGRRNAVRHYPVKKLIKVILELRLVMAEFVMNALVKMDD